MVLKSFFSLIAGICMVALLSMKSERINLLESHEKKVKKSISRVWKNQDLTINALNDLDTKDELILRDLNGELYQVEQDSQLGFLYLGKANACHEGGCDRADDQLDERFEQFEYLLLFNDLKELKHIQILKYEAEYGYEICSKQWLKQFIKKPMKEYIYGKDIQAISGATVSAQSITNEINKTKEVLESL